jgi:ribonuclease T2
LLLIAAAGYALLDGNPYFSQPVSRPANDNQLQAEFDFYVLSLSWSPSHCERNGKRDTIQCVQNRYPGFVVHGLWPQREAGWPEFCSTNIDRVPAQVIDSMLDIMPSPTLILHQWRKHGSCSGLSPQDYFTLTRQAFERVKIPTIFRSPPRRLAIDPMRIEEQFEATNANLKGSMIQATCQQGNVQEVRVCLSKNLGFRPCPHLEYQACNAPSVAMPARSLAN